MVAVILYEASAVKRAVRFAHVNAPIGKSPTLIEEAFDGTAVEGAIGVVQRGQTGDVLPAENVVTWRALMRGVSFSCEVTDTD